MKQRRFCGRVVNYGKGPIVSVGADGNNLFFAWRRQILRCKICGRAMLAPTFRFERSINKRTCCSSLCNRLLVYLGLGGHRTGSAGVVLRAANLSSNDCRGQSHLDSGAARPTRSEQESSVSGETGDSQSKTFDPIRRAEASDWSGGFCSPYGSQNLSGPNWHRHCRSGGFTRLSSSKTYQSRVWPPALPGYRSGGFTRLSSSTTYQARVCRRRLAAKIPRFLRNGGF